MLAFLRVGLGGMNAKARKHHPAETAWPLAGGRPVPAILRSVLRFFAFRKLVATQDFEDLVRHELRRGYVTASIANQHIKWT
jgi:hypothetical protein